MSDDAPFSRYGDPYLEGPKPPAEQPTATQKFVEESKINMDEEESDGSIVKLVVVGIIVFLFLLLAGGGAFYFFKDNNGDDNSGGVFQPGENQSVDNKDEIFVYKNEDGSTVEVIVPLGALKEKAKIEIKKIANGAVTDKYQFAPKGLKFLRPAIVKIPYKENGLRKGETPHDIKLEYQAQAGAQKYLLWYEVDESAKKLITQVMGF